MLTSLLSLFVAALAAADDASGSWHLVFHNPGGEREMDASLKVDGGQVKGKCADTDVKGTYKDGALDLELVKDQPKSASN